MAGGVIVLVESLVGSRWVQESHAVGHDGGLGEMLKVCLMWRVVFRVGRYLK